MNRIEYFREWTRKRNLMKGVTMKRIRYYKQDDGSYLSKPLQAMHDMIQVKTVGLNWEVLSSEKAVLNQGVATDLITLRKDAKEAVKTLGVKFLDDSRNRSKNENPTE